MILKTGSRGAEVALLQNGLRRAGLYLDPPDGLFGSVTDRALRSFQRAEGIAADGIAGDVTWAKLSPWLTGYRIVRLAKGDTYFSLARRFQTSISAIQTANPSFDPLNLPVGAELIVPLAFPVVSDDVPVSSASVSAAVAGLAARFPFLLADDYGSSVLGRPLKRLTIGEGTRSIHFGAAIHANEWLTALLVLRFAEDYARALVSDDDLFGVPARRLFAETTLVLTPLENPDGVDLVTGAFPPGEALDLTRRIAAAYPSIAYPAGWKANARGIDLNLQFPAGWEEARRIKFARGFRSPAPRDYVGTAPLAAPEAAALARLTETAAFDRILAFHTQGGVIYWQFADKAPAGAEALGERLAAASGYSLEPTPAASANAGYKDWFLLKFDRPGYTVEAGLGTNPLPLSAFAAVYARVKPLMVEAMV